MGYGENVGKYQLGRTIGEGTFAKVKLGLDSQTGQSVAIKIIDKRMVVDNKLMDQVKAEITTMKLLQHPNIVRIYEVIATKTKIFIVMEYVSGGQLSDKMSYTKRLNESEARKYFQQLIDAVEYCHCRGVFHRDLKPENLLLDSQGNLKVSDFGLSAARKPGDLLSTACGSPSYVAPEVIANRNYYGAPVDVWSCGVILFELLAGFLPFDDRNLLNLYRKISKADYTFPHWFTPSQKKLISQILDPLPRRRMTIAGIVEDEWFQIDYKPSTGVDNDDSIRSQGSTDEMEKPKSPNFINAFKLIAMANDLDLSGLFEEQSDKKRTRLGSEHSIYETIEKIKAAAKDARLSVERMNSSKVKLQEKTKLIRCQSLSVSAEVIEVTPSHCVVEISKSAGELSLYKEFCRSLSGVLTERSSSSSVLETASEEGKVEVNKTPKT
ncbi:CBL-interacting serine/threonine-protein kinase 21 [Aristolochia californica]|uniref:CBL-interacting serine/threonine-protein kinase 21 n=1 Tax=Aristolochia californica TaxID=171875 RepID=UPI0035DBB9BC